MDEDARQRVSGAAVWINKLYKRRRSSDEIIAHASGVKRFHSSWSSSSFSSPPVYLPS